MAIPDGAQLGDGSSGDPENRGIHVTAADEVTVYGLNRIPATTDAFMGLPVDVLTTEYIVLGWPAPGVAAGPELGVRRGRYRRTAPT